MADLTRFQARLLHLVRRHGPRPVIAAITAVSVLASVVLTALSMVVDPPERSIVVFAMVTSVVIPLVVAPTASTLVVRLVEALATAYDALGHQATTDALTGLKNRRGFYEQIDALHAARRPDELVVAGMIDLDDLKLLNDAHGHPAGDAALALLGSRLGAAVGASGRAVAGRLGGDEFAVFAVVTEREAEALSRALHDAVTTFEAEGRIVGASIGLAVVTDEMSAEAALHQADAHLYERKRARSAPRTHR